MKDIPYNGILSEDISNLNKRFSFKNNFIFNFFATFFVICIPAVVAVKYDILPTDMQNIFLITGGNIGLSSILSFINSAYISRKTNKDYHSSLDKIKDLTSSLERECVKIDKSEIIDAQITEETTKSVTTDGDGNMVSKEKQIVEHFYMLDTKEQIRVLKQVRRYLQDSDEPSLELVLLEDGDYDKSNLPVCKTLRKK